MKTKLGTILFLLLIAALRDAAAMAHYAGKREMIQNADCIVVATITNVTSTEKKTGNWTYRQKAYAKVERCLKGEIKGEIEIYGMESFICAQCRYEKGRFILFLSRCEGIWVGANWGIGIRPIAEDRVEWFSGSTPDCPMKETPLDRAVADIAAIIKEQSQFCRNTVWRHMSYDGIRLTIPSSDQVADTDWRDLAANHVFRSLRSVSFANRHVTGAAFKCLLDAPIEELDLSGCTYSSDDLVGLLDHLPRLSLLNTACTSFSDAELAHVNGSNLTTLVIYNTDVTDAGLANLVKFRSLTHLNLPGKQLTNKGYEALRHLARLKELALEGKGVTDSTIQYLRDLPLGELSIYEGDISDRSMETLCRVTSLTSLGLPKCRIGDRGIAAIVSLEQLREIRLWDAPVTDAAMHHLAQMRGLRSIDLFCTGISDAGLATLKDMPDLKRIDIKHTKVTREGVEAFKRRFPSFP